MDQRQIEEIVRSVLGQLSQPAGASAASASNVRFPVTGHLTAGNQTVNGGEAPLPDLGSDEFQQKWIGVQNPKNRAVLEELRASTRACVSGRSDASAHHLAAALFGRSLALQRHGTQGNSTKGWVTASGLIKCKPKLRTKTCT